MKKITLLFITMFASFVMYAQGVYVVDICGTIANANGGEQVDVSLGMLMEQFQQQRTLMVYGVLLIHLSIP